MSAHLPAAPGVARLPSALPRAFVFDMDGLMLDTERLDRDLWRAATQRLGIAFPDSLHAALVGRPVRETRHTLRAHFGADFPLEELQQRIHEEWLRIVDGPGLPRKPGLERLLGLLEGIGMPMAVATSTARAKAIRSLGDLAPRFAVLTGGDEVQRGKPAPDIFLLAAQRLGLAPAQCLVLEDSPAGVTAAQAAGMTVIMIPDTVAPSAPPPYQCESLEQVSRWVQAFLDGDPGSSD